mgnify:CR=1 FL=1
MEKTNVIKIARIHLNAARAMGQEQQLADALLATYERGESSPLWKIAASVWLLDDKVADAYYAGRLASEIPSPLPSLSEVENWEEIA